MSYGIARYSLPKLDPICTLPTSHCTKILKDLIRKNPLGPIGDLSDYKDTSAYQPEHLKGYAPIALFRLGIRDKDTLRHEIIAIKYPGSSSEDLKNSRRSGIITRYVNRSWPILRSAILSVKSSGGLGIYEVYDYRFGVHSLGTLGFVYADDMSTALIIGEAIFGFIAPDTTLRVRFVEWEDKDCVDILNLGLMSTLSENITRLTEKKEELEKIASLNKSHIESLANIVRKLNN